MNSLVVLGSLTKSHILLPLVFLRQSIIFPPNRNLQKGKGKILPFPLGLIPSHARASKRGASHNFHHFYSLIDATHTDP